MEGLQRGQRGSLASEPASALVPSWESSSRSARKAAITYTYPVPTLLATSKILNLENFA